MPVFHAGTLRCGKGLHGDFLNSFLILLGFVYLVDYRVVKHKTFFTVYMLQNINCFHYKKHYT